MIKLETHCHTKGASPCADGGYETLADKYASNGYGGVVITNHISPYSYDHFQGDTHKEKIDYYFNCYREIKDVLNKRGIKTFWGTEVRINIEGFAEYVLYGLEEKDVYDSAPLFTFTQEELFRFAEKKGAFMYQPHPFRTKVVCGNPEFMHGAEAFNGHYGHFNYNHLADDFCEKNGLIKMSGTDYHHDDQPVTAAIFVPDDVSDEKALKDFLMNNRFELFCDFCLYERSLKKLKG